MNIHEKLEGLYQHEDSFAFGELVQLQYLPTERSRKWRNASLLCPWSANALEHGRKAQIQEGWAYVRFVRK